MENNYFLFENSTTTIQKKNTKRIPKCVSTHFITPVTVEDLDVLEFISW